MDKRIVGVNAGNVWHVLNEVKRISIPELARKLNLSVESTALAVGWLARENKVCIHRVNGLIEVYDESHFGLLLDKCMYCYGGKLGLVKCSGFLLFLFGNEWIISFSKVSWRREFIRSNEYITVRML